MQRQLLTQTSVTIIVNPSHRTHNALCASPNFSSLPFFLWLCRSGLSLSAPISMTSSVTAGNWKRGSPTRFGILPSRIYPLALRWNCCTGCATTDWTPPMSSTCLRYEATPQFTRPAVQHCQAEPRLKPDVSFVARTFPNYMQIFGKTD